jgi:hypothetical protein
VGSYDPSVIIRLDWMIQEYSAGHEKPVMLSVFAKHLAATANEAEYFEDTQQGMFPFFLYHISCFVRSKRRAEFYV